MFYVCLFSELRHINSGFVELLFQELSFKWSVAERSPSSLNRELEWFTPPGFIFFILETKSLPCTLVPFDKLPRKVREREREKNPYAYLLYDLYYYYWKKKKKKGGLTDIATWSRGPIRSRALCVIARQMVVRQDAGWGGVWQGRTPEQEEGNSGRRRVTLRPGHDPCTSRRCYFHRQGNRLVLIIFPFLHASLSRLLSELASSSSSERQRS